MWLKLLIKPRRSRDLIIDLNTVMSQISQPVETDKDKAMKKEIHPNYKEVVFKDVSSDFAILTRSTIETKDTIEWTDGKEYPLYKVDISSASHPFYTGTQKVLDTEGRVERFNRKFGRKKQSSFQ